MSRSRCEGITVPDTQASPRHFGSCDFPRVDLNLPVNKTQHDMLWKLIRPFPSPSRLVICQDTVSIWPLNMTDRARSIDLVLFIEHLVTSISVYLTKREVTMV